MPDRDVKTISGFIYLLSVCKNYCEKSFLCI